MKPKRVKNTSQNDEDSQAASITRSYFLNQEKKGETPMTGVEISLEVLRQFSADHDLVPKLADEMTRDQVQYLVDECAMILGGSQVTGAHWNAVAHFLFGELTEFREMKADYASAERKLVMVSQRLNEATNPADGNVCKTRVMACAMIFGETEMRRDNLKARTLMIINELTKRIMAYLGSRSDSEELEIRLRGVLGNL
ncbi:MAG: hypothetical protein QNL33_01035 [Akkermansiaceae bacterium]|jgi:hypothetical protein